MLVSMGDPHGGCGSIKYYINPLLVQYIISFPLY